MRFWKLIATVAVLGLFYVGHGLHVAAGGRSVEPVAHGQGIAGGGLFIQGDQPAIITSSVDGKTIHVWGLGPHAQVLSPIMRPQLIESITAR